MHRSLKMRTGPSDLGGLDEFVVRRIDKVKVLGIIVFEAWMKANNYPPFHITKKVITVYHPKPSYVHVVLNADRLANGYTLEWDK